MRIWKLIRTKRMMKMNGSSPSTLLFIHTVRKETFNPRKKKKLIRLSKEQDLIADLLLSLTGTIVFTSTLDTSSEVCSCDPAFPTRVMHPSQTTVRTPRTNHTNDTTPTTTTTPSKLTKYTNKTHHQPRPNHVKRTNHANQQHQPEPIACDQRTSVITLASPQITSSSVERLRYDQQNIHWDGSPFVWRTLDVSSWWCRTVHVCFCVCSSLLDGFSRKPVSPNTKFIFGCVCCLSLNWKSRTLKWREFALACVLLNLSKWSASNTPYLRVRRLCLLQLSWRCLGFCLSAQVSSDSSGSFLCGLLGVRFRNRSRLLVRCELFRVVWYCVAQCRSVEAGLCR